MPSFSFKFYLGALMVLALIAAAVFAPLLPISNPNQVHWKEPLRSASPEHRLGQDEEGRDVLARVVFGARISLGIALATVALSALIGVSVGLSAGYFGGKIDEAFILVSDLFLAFPSILLMIAVAAILPASFLNIILILSFVSWVSYARLTRGQVLAVKRLEYVQAAQVLGTSRRRILFRHILPNILGPLQIQASLSLAGVILAESTLSFLGLGLPPGTPSWGSMLDSGVSYLLIAPHLSIVPGAAIAWAVLGFNLLGDELRERVAR